MSADDQWLLFLCDHSIGLASTPIDGSTTRELLSKADARLCEAKRGGGTCVVGSV